MADIVGLIASVITLLDGAHEVSTVVRKYIHSSSSLRAELIPTLGKLTAFVSILRGLQQECELDQSDPGRLRVLEHLRKPLEDSEKAAQAIVARLEQVRSVIGVSFFVGRIWDAKTTTALHVLEQSKAVLELALAADERTLLRSIELYLKNVAVGVDEIRSRLDHLQQNKTEDAQKTRKADVLDWVSTINHTSNYQAAVQLTSGNDSSGEWLFKNQRFEDWVSKPSSRGLLLSGIAGSGKTVLCSKAITHIRLKDTVNASSTFAYFFFDFNDEIKQAVEGMIRSLIVQLLFDHVELPNNLLNLYSKHMSGTVAPYQLPPLQDWLDILSSQLSLPGTKYIFIDALDECNGQDARLLLETLHTILEVVNPSVKWFLTCQSGHFFTSLSELDGIEHLPIDKAAVDEDIRTYLTAMIESDSRMVPHRRSKDLIVESIILKSDGMFHFARCQLNEIMSERDTRVTRLKTILKTMPTTIVSMYERILHHLKQSSVWPMVERVLVLVCYSARPVTIQEAAEFAVLEDDMVSIGPEERLELNEFTNILSQFYSFVIVQDQTLGLTHKSVQEFLIDMLPQRNHQQYQLICNDPETYIAKKCLQYLSFAQQPVSDISELRTVKNPNWRHLTRLCLEYPFLDYAASQWSHHIGHKELNSELLAQMKAALPLKLKPNLWKAWLLLQRADIWETQLCLAKLLCEALIRSSPLPGWADGFWHEREAYRIKNHKNDKTENNFTPINPGHGLDSIYKLMMDCEMALREAMNLVDAKAGIYVEALKSRRSSRLDELSFDMGDLIYVHGQRPNGLWKGTIKDRTGVFSADMVELPGKPFYTLAVTLLEIALQKELFAHLILLWDKVSTRAGLEVLLNCLGVLTKKARDIMGNEYGNVVWESLHNVKSAQQGKAIKLSLSQGYAMEKLHSPLQSMLRFGFRKSRRLDGARRKLESTKFWSAPEPEHNGPSRDIFNLESAPPMSLDSDFFGFDVPFKAIDLATAPPSRRDVPQPTHQFPSQPYAALNFNHQTTAPGKPTSSWDFSTDLAIRRPQKPNVAKDYGSGNPIGRPKQLEASAPRRAETKPDPSPLRIWGDKDKLLRNMKPPSNTEPSDYNAFPRLLAPLMPSSDAPPTFRERLQELGRAQPQILAMIDPEKRIKWAKRVVVYVDPPHVDQKWDLSLSALGVGDLEKDAKALQEAARRILSISERQHNPEAKFLLGYCFEFGKLGFDTDRETAHSYYQDAFEAGCARAAYRIGLKHEVAESYSLAMQYYQIGIDAEDPDCLCRVGLIASFGLYGEPRNYGRGVDLIHRSAERADETAPWGAFLYGMLLASQLPQLSIPPDYLTRDTLAARGYMEKAASLGCAKAQVQIAATYRKEGLAVGRALSIHYNHLAASQGDREAKQAITRELFGCGDRLEPEKDSGAWISLLNHGKQLTGGVGRPSRS